MIFPQPYRDACLDGVDESINHGCSDALGEPRAEKEESGRSKVRESGSDSG